METEEHLLKDVANASPARACDDFEAPPTPKAAPAQLLASAPGPGGAASVQHSIASADLNGQIAPCEPGPPQPRISVLPVDTPQQAPLSKNQLKKLKRKQEYEDDRENRKARRKQKNLERKERRRQAEPGETDGPQNAAKAARKKQRRSIQAPVTILIDCGFDDLMTDKERISLAAQITRSYSENAHAHFRSHMAVSSFKGHLRTRFETVLSGYYRAWKGVRFSEEDFVAFARESKDWTRDPGTGGKLVGAFAPAKAQFDAQPEPHDGREVDAEGRASTNAEGPATQQPAEEGMQSSQDKGQGTAAREQAAQQYNSPADGTEKIDDASGNEQGEVVYLTSDSPHTLTRLQPYGTYIIGGLVDRNRHKGICYQRAAAHGVRTAKLPIADYMDMSSRFVLATNHVAEILLAWLECGDWRQALMKVMPKRKGARLKGEDQDDDGGEEGENGGGRLDEGGDSGTGCGDLS